MNASVAQPLPIVEPCLSLAGTRYARPLVVRFGAMGDTVILLALIHALHARFNSLVDVVTTGSWARPLLQSQPAVGEVHTLTTRRTPYWLSAEKQRLVATLRRRGAGPTWMCNNDDSLRVLLSKADIPPGLQVDVRDCGLRPGEHFVDYWARIARQMPHALLGTAGRNDAPAAVHVPPLRVLPAWRADLDRWLQQRGLNDTPLLLVQAGNRRTMRWLPRQRHTNTKFWPEERWGQVIDRIAQIQPSAQVLLLGVRAEAGLNDVIQRHVRAARTHNVAGDMPIPRLLALQERAMGMISVDTGPAHSAAALGCPLVVMFGADKTSLYSPRSATGAVEVLIREVHGQASMLNIEARHVLDAWERLALRC
jgi:heptosyltransferase-2/heptosyltransferase-3